MPGAAHGLQEFFGSFLQQMLQANATHVFMEQKVLELLGELLPGRKSLVTQNGDDLLRMQARSAAGQSTSGSIDFKRLRCIKVS